MAYENVKVFWWGDCDDMQAMLPTLFYIDHNGMVTQEYNDKNERLRELIEEGYTEISRRTAYSMYLPIH